MRASSFSQYLEYNVPLVHRCFLFTVAGRAEKNLMADGLNVEECLTARVLIPLGQSFITATRKIPVLLDVPCNLCTFESGISGRVGAPNHPVSRRPCIGSYSPPIKIATTQIWSKCECAHFVCQV